MTNEKQLSKLLGILVEHMFFFKDISTEDAQWAIQNPKEAISLFIKAVKERSKEAVKSIFTPFSEFILEPVPKHNTKDYFQENKGIEFWKHRDLEKWTPKKRKAHEGGEYITNTITGLSFRMMAAEILNINLETEEISDKELQQQLIDNGHCVEMLQIDQEIKRFKNGAKDSPFAKDGRETFFFVDNYDGTVSVVSADWSSSFGTWRVHIDRFSRDDLWDSEYRVVSRKSH